jgi:hypothetical protein
MDTLKVDDRERYPRCLWISVAGSLAGAFSFGWNVALLNTALPYIAKDLHYHKDAVLSSAVVLGAGEQASKCPGCTQQQQKQQQCRNVSSPVPWLATHSRKQNIPSCSSYVLVSRLELAQQE